MKTFCASFLKEFFRDGEYVGHDSTISSYAINFHLGMQLMTILIVNYSIDD